MSYIKKKQVLGLQDDLTTLQYGLPILKRSTLFTGTPIVGEAILDSTDSENITSLYINVNDNILGNTYLQIQMYNEGDNLIIQDHNKNIILYNILSIEDNVDSLNEGYFILTIQHSFGYEGSLDPGEFVYYFKRDTLSIDDKIFREQFRAENAEMKLAAAIENIKAVSAYNHLQDEIARASNAEAQLNSLLNAEIIQRAHADDLRTKKYVESFNSSATTKTITHDLNTEDVIVQLIDTDSNSKYECDVLNYTSTSVDLNIQVGGNYKAIIIG